MEMSIKEGIEEHDRVLGLMIEEINNLRKRVDKLEKEKKVRESKVKTINIDNRGLD